MSILQPSDYAKTFIAYMFSPVIGCLTFAVESGGNVGITYKEKQASHC